MINHLDSHSNNILCCQNNKCRTGVGEKAECVIEETARPHLPAPFLIPRQSSVSARLRHCSENRVYVNAWEIHRDRKNLGEARGVSSREACGQPDWFQKPTLSVQWITFGIVTVDMWLPLANLLYWSVEDADSAFEFSIYFVRGLILTKTDKATHIQNKRQDYKTTQWQQF